MSDEQGFDLGALFQQAQAMQEQMLEAQARAASVEVEGQAGGGVVRVRANGGLEFKAVHIDPEVVDPSDPEMLEDLVLAALNDAVRQVNELQQQSMGGFDPGSVDLGGLGDLGGLLGIGGADDGDDEPDRS